MLRNVQWLLGCGLLLLVWSFACRRPPSSSRKHTPRSLLHSAAVRDDAHALDELFHLKKAGQREIVSLVPALPTKERALALQLMVRWKTMVGIPDSLLLQWASIGDSKQRLYALQLLEKRPVSRTWLKVMLAGLQSTAVANRRVAQRALLRIFRSGQTKKQTRQQVMSHMLVMLDTPPQAGGTWSRAVPTRQILGKLGQSWTPFLMKRYGSLGEVARGHLLLALSHHKHPGIAFFLAKGLKEKSAGIRRQAANALLHLRFRAVPVLSAIQRHLGDPDPHVRGQLLSLLQVLRGLAQPAFVALRQRWKEEKQPALRVQLLSTLDRLERKKNSLLPFFLQGLSSPHVELRKRAVQGWKKSWDTLPGARNSLFSALQDKDITVRSTALLWCLRSSSSILRDKAQSLCKSNSQRFAQGICP